jgi:hypothetical protein
MTFGQRNELGELFAGNRTDVDKFRETFRILHDVTPDFGNAEEVRLYASYYAEIIDGLLFWMEREKLLLNYQPEPEEIRAGIRELSAKTGCYGVVKALAGAYAQDPDDILKWEYGKVFGIVYTDLEEFKYRERLRKQYAKRK